MALETKQRAVEEYREACDFLFVHSAIDTKPALRQEAEDNYTKAWRRLLEAGITPEETIREGIEMKDITEYIRMRIKSIELADSTQHDGLWREETIEQRKSRVDELQNLLDLLSAHAVG